VPTSVNASVALYLCTETKLILNGVSMGEKMI